MAANFEQDVIAKLSRLETLMVQLVGNGQPGRIQLLESKVRRHDRLIWMAVGGAIVVGWGLRTLLAKVFGIQLP